MSDHRLSRNPDSLLGRLMSAGDRDEPSPHAVRRALVAAGLASSVSAATGGASAGTAGTLALIKWLTLGAIAGAVVTLAGSELVDRTRPGHAPSVRAPTAPHLQPSIDVATAVRTSTPKVPPPEMASRRAAGSVRAFEAAKALPRGSVEPPPTINAPVKAPDTLIEEAAAIERAGSAVRRRDGVEALRLLDDYQARFPRARLYPEATVLRVEALLLIGRRDAAREIAQRFLALHPRSPSAKRLRSLVGATTP